MRDRRSASTSLSAKIIACLTQRGHTQADIARILGVMPGFVSLVKSRERALTLDHLERIIQALSVPLEPFCSRSIRHHLAHPIQPACMRRSPRPCVKGIWQSRR
ncbi:helix-turn-helix domain-containing protein [Fontivita pretiosa]|uniref:helix-turn-helix domain-containing protein n=1 Tax=Fontivita pretiosa TaxID=2989684 RepID=UPI003D1791AB